MSGGAGEFGFQVAGGEDEGATLRGDADDAAGFGASVFADEQFVPRDDGQVVGVLD